MSPSTVIAFFFPVRFQETVLLKVVNDLTLSAEENNASDLVLLDLSASRQTGKVCWTVRVLLVIIFLKNI